MLTKFLKLFFHHLYHRLSWGYDFVADIVSIGQWKNWGTHTLTFVEGPRVLELGFGPGHLHLDLHKNGYHVFGLDESSQMIAQTTRRLTRQDYKSNLCRGVAQSLPYRTDTFDCLVATFPSEYIRDPQTLSEALRVLRKGGLMVVLLSVWISNKTILHKAAQTLFRITSQGAPIKNAFIDHARQPFIDSGFEVETQVVEKSGASLLYVMARKPRSL